MTVYVDDARIPVGRMLLAHLWADDRGELLAMADAIGIGRRHLRLDGAPHYLVCLARRGAALARGAVPADYLAFAEAVARAGLASPVPSRAAKARAALERIASERAAAKAARRTGAQPDLFGMGV